MNTKVYFEYSYHELEKLIADFYGWKEYEFVAVEELNNDSAWTATVKKEPLDMWQKEALDDMRVNGPVRNWQTRMLLQDMCNQGAIPEGNYLVEVSW